MEKYEAMNYFFWSFQIAIPAIKRKTTPTGTTIKRISRPVLTYA